MEQSDISFDQTAFSYLLYEGKAEFEKFLASKDLKNKYEFLKFRPETYAHEPNQHLAEEGKVLLELVKLQRSNQLNLKDILPFLKDLTPYSRTIQTHFSLFKNITQSFASQKNAQNIQDLIEKIKIVGSVLLQEVDFNRNTVYDTVEATATFHPETGKFLLNTPTDKAKLCRFYTPHSTHVILFARIKASPEAPLSAPYPFFIQLRNPQSLDLLEGISMKWLGPSFGGVSGREYAFEFKNFAVDADKLLLDKYVSYNNKKLEIKGDNAAIEYTTKLCLLLEQDALVEKSLREALKAAFLTVRYANNRTQFQTLEEKGKERPIFEYNYNKTRIMKGLIESLNLHSIWSTVRKDIYSSLSDTQKNARKFNDLFVFYDMFEAFVNERCLINVEAFRESVGGIGYLKYSGIPTLQENAMKNAVHTGPSKEFRYTKFVQLFVNVDLKNPGEFFSQVASWLVSSSESSQVTQQADFHQNFDFFRLFLGKKLLHYKKKIQETYSFKPSECPRELLSKITNFDSLTRLCETFLSCLKISALTTRLATCPNAKTNQQFLTALVAADITVNVLDDVPFFLSQEGKSWPEGSLNSFNENLARHIEVLGRKSVPLIESFGFDENVLHSCIAKTADETYEKMLNMSKNHNPRNDPKLQDEIRSDLLKFLNRPAKSNL